MIDAEHVYRWIVVVSLVGLAGCAHRAKPDAPADEATLEPGIYHVDSGDEIDESELVDRLAAYDYVVIGERHDRKWHHEIQSRLFAAIAERRRGGTALGMEMFVRSRQAALDAYIDGRFDEAKMLEETDWETHWGMDPALYRPLWSAAKRLGSPLVALNVPREVTREIARKGLEGLSQEERSRLPDRIDTSIESQRAFLRRIFGRHGGSNSADHGMKFEYFLQAQATWDETMAATAVDYVRGHESVDGMVVVAGRAHARRSFGIPPRIEHRLAGISSDTDKNRNKKGERVASVIPYDADESAPFGAVELANLREAQVADFVWIR